MTDDTQEDCDYSNTTVALVTLVMLLLSAAVYVVWIRGGA